ncbi:hypothetical protein E5676_scaffold352G001830 [Cucumis melo var. makuwa]|nr:hypothetical protein E6C27_scaffold236G004240 [Cucumis melo var. makuwa]TYK25061.1 hypothetical protein E5676_scaffold352G001830 [Cucumis melo var. makuwa]
MSQRPGRHQRRPSQGVFMAADYLSEPPPPPVIGPGSTVESGGPHSALLTRPPQQSRNADPVAPRPPAPAAANDAQNPAS